jgi:hypothetical protein
MKLCTHLTIACELALGRQAAQVADLDQVLGVHRGILALLVQPSHEVLDRALVLLAVGDLDRDNRAGHLGRKLRQHVLLEPPDVADGAQLVVQFAQVRAAVEGEVAARVADRIAVAELEVPLGLLVSSCGRTSGALRWNSPR